MRNFFVLLPVNNFMPNLKPMVSILFQRRNISIETVVLWDFLFSFREALLLLETFLCIWRIKFLEYLRLLPLCIRQIRYFYIFKKLRVSKLKIKEIVFNLLKLVFIIK